MTSWDRKVLRKNSEETSQIQRKQDVEDKIGKNYELCDWI